MPELKHTFMSGRMNKDLDERLVPNGEYRDAANIEVLTSEGSDMGAVQTCLGNKLISDLVPDNESTCVGNVVDDKTNNVYYFIAGKPPTISSGRVRALTHVISSDLVVEYNSAVTGVGTTLPVIVDIYNVRTGITNASLSNLTYTLTSVEGLRIGMEIDVTVTGILAWTQQLPRPIITEIPTSNTVILSSPITSDTPQGILTNSNAFNNQSVDVNVNFTAPRVLNFNGNNLITGVNIVDDMLFWTDNYSEPKKVNITRGKEGSIPPINICRACNFNHNTINPYTFNGNIVPGTTHTELVVDGNTIINTSHNGIPLNPPVPGIQEYIQEKHITVIKKSPLTPPKLEMSDAVQRYAADGITLHSSSSIISNWAWQGTIGAFTGLYEAGTTSRQVNTDPAVNPVMIDLDTATDYRVGDILRCSDSIGGPMKVKLIVTSSDSTSTNPTLVNSPTIGNLEVKILDVTDKFKAEIDNNQRKTWYIELQSKEDSLYELKFPKFAYRYKYEDGEYSAFSPFSEIAFLPGKFEYHPKQGYNLGMVNHLRKLIIKDFIPTNIPKDVVEVDILYKESDSPNVYTIRSFTDIDPEWTAVGTGNHQGNFEIKDDLIHAVVASNQLLRPWDNVPRKALAQEITGNRLVYGNYLQNYNLSTTATASGNYVKPEFKVFMDSDPINVINFPEKSLKSMRTYQLGIVYKDIYGRETPVITHPSGVIKTENIHAASVNSISVQTITPPPIWADSFKYFVKETSNEYYNLAMDRWYDAEDEGVWLAFPSEDRNKVDEETTLLLKRGAGDFGQAVLEQARYKILAIKNEAPDFIKTTEEILATFDANTDPLATIPSGYLVGFPTTGVKNIKIDGEAWEESELVSLQYRENQQSLYQGILSNRGASLQMRIRTGNNANHSNWYDVINITWNKSGTGYGNRTSTYQITVTEGFDNDDIDFTSTGGTPGTAIADLQVDIQKKIIENKPEFDGRFFVKIHDDDDIFRRYIKADARVTSRHTTGQKLFYYMGKDSTADPNDTTGETIMGQQLSNFDDHYTSVLDDARFGEDFIAYDIGGSSSTSSSTTPSGLVWDGTGFVNPTATAANGGVAVHYPRYSNLTTIGTPWRAKGEYYDFYKNYLSLAHYTGGSAISPGTPWANSNAGSTGGNEGGWWFIDQEPVYHCLGTEIKDSGSSLSATNQTYNEWTTYSTFNQQHVSLNVRALVYLKNDTGIGAVKGNTEMDVSWIGTRNWPYLGHSTTSSSTGTWRNFEGLHQGEAEFVQRISHAGKIFRFIDDPDNIEYEIGSVSRTYHKNYDHVGYNPMGLGIAAAVSRSWVDMRVRFRLQLIEPGSKDPLTNPNGTPMKLFQGASGYIVTDPPNVNSAPVGPGANDAVTKYANGGGTDISRAGIEFVEPFYDQKQEMPTRPAIWETEPKEDVGLDIYHEVSQAYPVHMKDDTEELYIQIGATVDYVTTNFSEVTVVSVTGSVCDPFPNSTSPPATGILFDQMVIMAANEVISFKNPDGSIVTATVTQNPLNPILGSMSICVSSLAHGEKQLLDYYNCYSFGNGVESNRVRDLFNAVTIDKGVKASTTLAEQYKEENRKNGLIFSGIYNSMNGVNRLNQFIMAENITKDLNPGYGSIQKLHTRDTDLITLCEDKILKVLSNKDALYNADDTKNITATSNVLGNSIPFVGEYGISKNPESFASEAFRAYFTDRERGAVMRLSRDGLTPISDHGMKDWFADNLKTVNTLIGNYDSRKALYNITLKDYVPTPTVSFSERSKGWVSFKAFNPEVGFSLNNEYYTAQDGRLWKHHEDSVDRNSFYDNTGTINTSSSITVLFNDLPSVIKSFTTLNYEGSQSKIIENLAGVGYTDSSGTVNWSTDNKYYNNQPELGWYVNSVITDQQTGTVAEFINKEGKWFNYIIGEETIWRNGIVPDGSNAPISGAGGNLDTKEFSTQGIGTVTNPPVITTV